MGNKKTAKAKPAADTAAADTVDASGPTVRACFDHPNGKMKNERCVVKGCGYQALRDRANA